MQTLIKNIYSENLDDHFLMDQSHIICDLMDSHYFATIMFPNNMSKQLHYFSNNPDEFNDVYVPLQSQDVLIDTLVNHNSPVFYKEVVKMDINGKDDFFEPIQKVRPVSDCCYVPIKVQGRLCGFTAIARAGLNNRNYDTNDLEIFQFLTTFLNEGFIRTLNIPSPEGNQAYLDGHNNVISAGDAIREVFKTLFGEQYWDKPAHGNNAASRKFKNDINNFNLTTVQLNSGSTSIEYNDSHYVLQYKKLLSPNYRSLFSDEPQIEIVLKDDISRQNRSLLFDLGKVKQRYHFTPRELQIIDCIFQGMGNKEIAQQLLITQSTVKRHIWNIFNKTGVDSRTKLIFALV